REKLAAHALARGELAEAERHLGSVIAADPLREPAQRSLMEVLAAGGNYAGALRAYQELRQHLHRALNAGPDPESQSLFQRLRAEARAKAAANPPPRHTGDAPSAEVPTVAGNGTDRRAHLVLEGLPAALRHSNGDVSSQLCEP